MKEFLSANVAASILKDMEVVAILDSVSKSYATLNGNGDYYGSIDLATFDKIASQKRFRINDTEKARILFHENNKSFAKSVSKANLIPEGAVVFPEENFVMLWAGNDKRKERVKFLTKIVNAAIKGLDPSEFAVKHTKGKLKGEVSYIRVDVDDDSVGILISGTAVEDFFTVPYVDLTSPTEIKWAVRPNEYSKNHKYAWVGFTLAEAINKMVELADI